MSSLCCIKWYRDWQKERKTRRTILGYMNENSQQIQAQNQKNINMKRHSSNKSHCSNDTITLEYIQTGNNTYTNKKNESNTLDSTGYRLPLNIQPEMDSHNSMISMRSSNASILDTLPTIPIKRMADSIIEE